MNMDDKVIVELLWLPGSALMISSCQLKTPLRFQWWALFSPIGESKNHQGWEAAQLHLATREYDTPDASYSTAITVGKTVCPSLVLCKSPKSYLDDGFTKCTKGSCKSTLRKVLQKGFLSMLGLPGGK